MKQKYDMTTKGRAADKVVSPWIRDLDPFEWSLFCPNSIVIRLQYKCCISNEKQNKEKCDIHASIV